MSWHEIKPRMGSRTHRREGVELSIRLEGKRPVLRLSLGDDILESLGWERGQRVSLYRGAMADEGMLTVARADTGTLTLRTTGPAGRAILVESSPGAILCGGKEHEPTRCKHHVGRITLEDGTVLEPILAVALPGWARNGNGGGK